MLRLNHELLFNHAQQSNLLFSFMHSSLEGEEEDLLFSFMHYTSHCLVHAACYNHALIP